MEHLKGTSLGRLWPYPERLTRDKLSSLLQKSVNYSNKKFYITGPCQLQSRFNWRFHLLIFSPFYTSLEVMTLSRYTIFIFIVTPSVSQKKVQFATLKFNCMNLNFVNVFRGVCNSVLGCTKIFWFFPQNFEDSDFFEDFFIFTISPMLNLKRFFEIFCDFLIFLWFFVIFFVIFWLVYEYFLSCEHLGFGHQRVLLGVNSADYDNTKGLGRHKN